MKGSTRSRQRSILKVIRWTLFAVIIVTLISGFGISEFRVIETITFGLLTKNVAFRIHDVIWIPFVVLLVLHVFYSFFRRLYLKFSRGDKGQ